MIYLIIIILICVVGYIVFSRMKEKEEEPIDTYVCSECGEKHCDCNRVENE